MPKQINLSKWQTIVSEDNHRYKVINCGRRAGKSFLVSTEMYDFATKHNNSIVWFISPTYKQSKEIVWQILHDLIAPEFILHKNETELKIELINGSQICLKGGDDADALRGVRIDFCVFDECAFFEHWDEAMKVIRPTLIDSKASCWYISTPNGFNHFKKLAETTDPDFKYFHFTSYDNPYIDPKELDKVRDEMDGDSFAQEILGEFRKVSGLVYKDFSREKHMVDIPELSFNYTFTRTLDFGFAHKTALIYFAISPTGDAIYGYDGIYQEGLIESQIAEVIKIKDAGRVITNPVADSAQPMSIQALKEHGVFFKPVEKAPDSVKNGIVKVAELLKVRADTGRPTLMFNKHLTWIADEFERYRWMENKSADRTIKEVPMKVDDDACFTKDTKVLTMRGNVPINSISEEDCVYTPYGWAKVIKCMKTGKKLVKNYELFKATPNHKILTSRGLVEVDNLRYSDIIMLCAKPSTFVGRLIDVIQIPKIELIGFIFNALLIRSLEVERAFYIAMFGNSIKVKFLMVFWFIILTGIAVITILIILSLSVIASMLKGISGVFGMAWKNILTIFDNLPKNGMLLKKEKKNISGLERNHIKTESYLIKSALYAGKNTGLILQKADTVIKTARRQRFAEEEVYNLASSNGMYFANNVLVSNCDAIRYFAMEFKKPAAKKIIGVGGINPYIPNTLI